MHTMSKPIDVTTATFDREVLSSPLPTLVDFHAPWCGPCKAIAPALDRLAEEFAGQIKIVKVDVDQSDSLARRYGISGIPTLLLFQRGRIQDTVVGLISPQALKAKLAAAAEPAEPAAHAVG
jgi:thioredoxin